MLKKLFGQRVLIKQIPQEEPPLIICKTNYQTAQGIVVQVGEDALVQENDRVIFPLSAKTEVLVNGHTFWLLRQADLIAIV